MYIEKLHIESFGKLTDFTLELGEGVNIVEGSNESGKSTVASFIKFIFYGLAPKDRKVAASWHTGGLAGSITLVANERRFRVERSCSGRSEVLQLIDGETNMPIRGIIDDVTPGELFLGVSGDMFEATAFVSQLGGTVSGGAKVSEGIENILFSADESVNTQKALSKLDTARAAILHKNEKGGRLFELDTECAQAEIRLSAALRAHDEILLKEAQLADMREKHAAADEKAREISSKVEQFELRELLETFDEARKIREKCEKMRSEAEESANVDIEAVRTLESDINRLDALRKEALEASEREASTPAPEADEELDKYTALGGRAELEARRDMSRSKMKAYIVGGIAMIIIALGLIFVGILRLIMGDTAHLVSLVALGVLAITLFALAVKARANAAAIDRDYDFDALDARLREHAAAVEEAKVASLAATDAARRFDEAQAQITARYGCSASELAERLEAQRAQLHAANSVRAEYDKYMTVLSQMETQLRSYDEAELREKLDTSVDLSAISAEKLPELRREVEFSEKMVLSIERHIADIEKTLAGLYPGAEDPSAVSDKLSALKAERELLTKRHAALILAAEKLSEASESLRQSISPRLADATAKLMAHITEGKYKTFGVGAGLELCVETEAGTKGIDVLSCGTKDAAYLSLRMALVSLLYRKEMPPMLYDEAFVRQDAKRLGAMLKLVHISGLQSIVFTSNQREAELMQSIGEYKHIKI